MSREDDFAARMIADATLMSALTGGVYKSGAVGLLGITRETTPSAFDASGFLKPSALVKQRGRVPTGEVVDYAAQITSTRQIVEIWIYCDWGSGYTAIDTAISRLYALFQGHQFADTFEVALANIMDRQRDPGPLNGASLARIDFAVISLMGV